MLLDMIKSVCAAETRTVPHLPDLLELLTSSGTGNQPPVRREDSLSDAFSLPQLRKLIGYILALSWDCHFLSLRPAHHMVEP